ncbi:DUF6233 domain-containing protein [Streptomyces atroolivaceus]|uniref:DUF6233 domain-containing protein n=1 Tax=Streptomyces atroolivaceus TaxID=66869 RepID=UPI0037B830F9
MCVRAGLVRCHQLGIGVGAKPVEIHVGHCYTIGRRRKAITREQAQAALAEGVDACTYCRRDTDLGLL